MQTLTDWNAKAAWMREIGASSATFDPFTGSLTSVTLGPAPASTRDETSTQQVQPTAEEQQRARDERRRIALGASGGPLRRVEVDVGPMVR